MDSSHTGRNTWTFDYQVKEIREALTDRIKHHVERVEFWIEELTETENKLREEGVTFTEPSYTGGARLEARLDDNLTRRLQDCRGSIRWHENRLNDYESFMEALKREKDERILSLTADDVDFFFKNASMQKQVW